MEKEEMRSAAEGGAEEGRGGDTVLAHLSLGELVIPRAFLDDPQVMEQMKALFEQAGSNINEFMVGDAANKINPETGYPEFFSLGKALKSVAKIATGGLVKQLLPKSLQNVYDTVAPIALTAVGQPGLAAAYTGLNNYSKNGNIGQALLSAGGTYGLSQAGSLGNLGGTSIGNAVNNAYQGSLLQDLYTGASGALDKVSSGVNDIYNGSALQSAFKSGGDALKSIGIDTASTASAPAPSVGGGISSYGPQLPSSEINGLIKTGANTYAVPAATGAAQVASSKNYLTPVLSALLGSNANSQAENALLKQQKANQALLAPYTQGFSFTPGDLTQDPGYQFSLSEGNKAAERAQLARGGYFSGAAAKELAQFNQGLADSTYNTAYNRALGAYETGLKGALAGAGVNENIGNIKANAATNQGNLYSGALGAILPGSTFTNTGALQGQQQIPDWLRAYIGYGR